jgi:hypothetical protein
VGKPNDVSPIKILFAKTGITEAGTYRIVETRQVWIRSRRRNAMYVNTSGGYPGRYNLKIKLEIWNAA